MQGIVRCFIAERGYGFITPDGGGGHVFVHSSALADAGIRFLREGQRVQFTVEASPKGPRAVNVVVTTPER